MKKLKLFFSVLMLLIMSIGQMWGYTITFSTGSGDGTSASTSTACSTIVSEGSSYLSGNLATATKVYYGGSNGVKLGTSSASGAIKMNLASATNVTSIVVSAKLYNSSKAATLKVNGGTAQSITSSFSNLTFDVNSEISYLQLEGSKYCWIESVTVNTSGGGSSEPTISADPDEVTDIAAEGVTDQAIALTYENIENYETEVSVHPNEDGTGTLSPAWLNASVSDADDYATITYSVSANDGAARTAYIKVYTTDGDKEATTIIPISQIKYSVPTGTFNKFTSSTLTEGDYVITYNTYTLKNSVSSNRWENGTTIANGASALTNPDESIIWHIAKSGDYWTLYNAAVEKYAAGTNSKNQGSMVDMPQAGVSDLMKWTAALVENTTTWNIDNYGRSQASSDSGNKWLRQNGTNGWATYASGTGGALTLYKKATAPKAVTVVENIENGSVSVTGSADLSAVAEGTELTLSNTPADGYKLTAYDVYKTGESTTKVTVTNGKFNMPDYDVTVSASFELAKVLTGIEITTPATQTTFWQGETFNYDGLEVTAHFDGGDDDVVTPASVTGSTATAGDAITVTISYNEGGEPETTTYNIVVKAVPNTAETAYSVAEAKDLIDKLGEKADVYVKGIISQIDKFDDTYKSITYWISDDGTTDNQFEAYSGKDFNGADFSAQSDLEEGQLVIIKGTIKLYKSVYEFNFNNEIVSRPKVLKSIALSGTYPTEFTQGDAFSSEGLVVTASYNYGDDAAVAPTSVTGYNMSATGEQTITVSYTEEGITRTATYIISIAAPDNCQNKATITKGAENASEGTYSLSVSGEQCLDELEGNVISTTLKAVPETHYHLKSVTATVGEVGEIVGDECTISEINASTTITAVFAEDAKATFSFAKGEATGTEAAPEAIANKYASDEFNLPACPFTYSGYKFNGWKHSATNAIYNAGASYTVTAADATAGAITFTAQWIEGGEANWNVETWASANSITSNTNLVGNYATIAADVNVSLTWSKANGSNVPAYNSSNKQARLYQNTTLQIAATESKLIKKVTFTFYSTNTGTLSANVGTYSSNIWTGLANTITFTNTGSAAYIKSINIEYIKGTTTTLSIDNASLKLSEGTKALSITCNVTPTPAISYAIAEVDLEIATIENGEITAHKVGGPINVTASIAQGDNYTEAVANFTITVTDKTPTEMSFPQASYDANLGSDFVEPVLTTNPANLSISYSSSVEAVATVDASTGVVTLKAEGTTVITVSFAGNDDYATNTATYTLNVIDPNKDVLTAALIGKTSYENWSDKTFGSSVKYAGNSTTNSGNIQLRASDGSGIVSTTKIGYLKKLTATRGNNTSGHYAEIYAKSTAYESASDLYDATKCGTLIGTLPETGDCELDFVVNEGYRYIGIKSKTGAVYYSDISITWQPAEFVNYSVTYKAGEGSGDDVVVANQESGTVITLANKPAGFSYANHEFAGWKLNGEGDVLAVGSSHTVSANVNFIAQWTPLYTVTYQAGVGATGEDVAVENIPAGNYTLAAKPNGFSKGTDVFRGWKLNDAGELLEAGANYVLASNATFVAQWDVEKQEAELAYATTAYTIQLGEAFEAQELTNPHNVTVTYTGNNDAVATVNANTGAITLQGGIGTVTITASSAATIGYYEGSASYTLKVIPVVDLSKGVWVLVSDASSLAAGDYLVIGSKDHDATAGDISNQVMGVVDTKIYAVGSSAAIPEIGEGTKVLKLGGNSGAWTLTNESGVLGATATKKLAWDSGTTTWSISIASGNATILNGTESYGRFLHNTTTPRFTTYASTTSTSVSMLLPQLYRFVQDKYLLRYVAEQISSSAPANVLVNSGASVTLPAAPTSRDGHTFLGWQVNGELMQPSSTLENITSNTTISAMWEVTIQEGEEISASDLPSNAEIEVPSGATLTIDKVDAPGIVAKAGSTINIVGDETTSESNPVQGKSMKVEIGGTINVTAPTVVNDNFYVASRRGQGGTGGTPTSSGKINGADKVRVESPGQFDFTLAIDVSTPEGAAKAEAQWHDFSVPFPVNALTGVYGYRYHEAEDEWRWDKLTNEVDYAILDFHGDIRANGNYSWKKCRGELTPGKIYSLTVNGDIQTYRFMKTASSYQLESQSAQYHYYGEAVAQDALAATRYGWNGLGNSKLSDVAIAGGSSVKVYVLVYDEEHLNGHYKMFTADKITLMIGSAFLVQQPQSADGVVSFTEANEGTDVMYYAPARSGDNQLSEVQVTFTDGLYTDNLYLSADEDATNNYEIGKDVVKMFNTTTPTVPTLYTTNYNGVKLASEHAPLYGQSVDYALTLFAPKAGEYTIASTQTEDNVYLTYNGEVIWNLSSSAYMLDLAQGAEESYGIRIVRAPQVATAIENGTDSKAAEAGVQKILLDEHVYILRNGQRYDVTGKIAK